MKFNSLLVIGVLFLALGTAVLVHPQVVMPAKRRQLEIAGQKVIMETRRVVAIPGVVGVLVIVAGAAALLLSQLSPAGRRR